MLSSDDLPAPDGPMIAVNSPDWNVPEIPFKMSLVAVNDKYRKINIVNS